MTDFIFVESAQLIQETWLSRVVNLKTSKGIFKITYLGSGIGFESVFINDKLISKKYSSLWFIPNFSFDCKGINFSVNVRVYPWLMIRKFWIEVNNNIVYSE